MVPVNMTRFTKGASWSRLGIAGAFGAAGYRFWLLVAFLLVLMLTGGSASPDELQLALLRPAAIVFAAIALLTMRKEQWYCYRHIWLLLGSALLLTLLHLLPLPPTVWQELPGRAIIVDIDQVAALGNPWRPLSMDPEATVNAAYALAIPLAVALLAAQLDATRQGWLLLVVTGLAVLTGLVVLIQASGTSLPLYKDVSPLAGLFANRNHQGLLLALAIPMAAAWAAQPREDAKVSRIRRYGAIAIIVILVPLIALTASRSAVVAGGIALASLPLFWTTPGHAPARPGPEAKALSGARRGWIVPVAWAGVALATAALLYATAMNRETTFDRLEGTSSDSRFAIWSSTIDMLGHFLPWGSGIGGYASAYKILEPAELLEPAYANHAHNEWLEIAMTAGIPGLVILGLAAILLCVAAWQALRGAKVANLNARMGAVVIFMLAIASTADYPVRTPILSAILAMAAIWATPGGIARGQARAS